MHALGGMDEKRLIVCPKMDENCNACYWSSSYTAIYKKTPTVLKNLMPNCLRTSSFARLNIMELYAIRMHLKSSWPWEYFVRHGDGSVDNGESR